MIPCRSLEFTLGRYMAGVWALVISRLTGTAKACRKPARASFVSAMLGCEAVFVGRQGGNHSSASCLVCCTVGCSFDPPGLFFACV